MPYPGGKHAPGHYVPAGGGSFFSSPFVLVDAEYDETLVVAIGRGIRFIGDNDGQLRVNKTNGSFEVVTTVPLQFFEGLPANPGSPTFWKVRLAINTTGDGTEFRASPAGVGTGDSEGVWFTIGSGATWDLNETVPTVFSNISVYELALADEVVKARATITLTNRY